MGTIRSGLLEKAGFGQFQQENQDALATFQQAKQDIRTKRKLGEAQDRAEQIRVKFNDRPSLIDDGGLFREAKISVGNRVNPIRATYTYGPPPNTLSQNASPQVKVHGIYDSNVARANDPVNQVFKPSQLKQVLEAVKNRFPKATQLVGERVTGVRSNSPAMATIPLKEGGLASKLKGKKLGLLGLGLSLGEAIRAGKAAYDANEGKL